MARLTWLHLSDWHQRGPDFDRGVVRDALIDDIRDRAQIDSRLEQIRAAGVDAVIGGHSGIPFGQSIRECYWLNAGVIGMPANDGGSHGWYMLLQPRDQGIDLSWHRLDYDHVASRKTTIEAGMSAYGQALGDGLWPSIDILPEAEARQTGKPLILPPLRVTPSDLSVTSTVAGQA